MVLKHLFNKKLTYLISTYLILDNISSFIFNQFRVSNKVLQPFILKIVLDGSFKLVTLKTNQVEMT